MTNDEISQIANTAADHAIAIRNDVWNVRDYLKRSDRHTATVLLESANRELHKLSITVACLNRALNGGTGVIIDLKA